MEATTTNITPTYHDRWQMLGGDRFYSIDISDPANPVIVDSVQANTRLINDIMTDKEGKVLVFTREGAADRKNGLVICTLDDPLHPKVVSEFTDGVTAGVHSSFVSTQPKYGTHVYLTNDGTGALHILDINDAAHPKEVGRWKTPRADAGRVLHDVDVQDGLVYASWWDDGLVILDVGNGIKGGSPSNPQLVSQFKYDLDKLYHFSQCLCRSQSVAVEGEMDRLRQNTARLHRIGTHQF